MSYSCHVSGSPFQLTRVWWPLLKGPTYSTLDKLSGMGSRSPQGSGRGVRWGCPLLPPLGGRHCVAPAGTGVSVMDGQRGPGVRDVLGGFRL